MTGTQKRSGVDLRVAIVGAIVLVLVLGGAAAWAYSTNNDLQATRSTLGSASGDLDSTKSELERTQAELQQAQTDVAERVSSIEDNQERIKTITFQIERKGDCIAAQAANLAEMRRIMALERENLARTMSGSTWATSFAAEQKAINAAIAYLEAAYTSASAGRYSQANSNITKSNAQIRASNAQVDKMNKAIDEINKATDTINAAQDAFDKTLDETLSTCGG
jgi:septal ring factor EnvC (AmiA/AmiB activator)